MPDGTRICPKWHVLDAKMKFCDPTCPKYEHMAEVGLCLKGCPYGWHMDYDGLCIKGCPPTHIVGPSGVCHFQDYTRHVNGKYLLISILALVCVCCCIIAYCYKRKIYDPLPYFEIQSHLAVALAKIHNLNEERK